MMLQECYITWDSRWFLFQSSSSLIILKSISTSICSVKNRRACQITASVASCPKQGYDIFPSASELTIESTVTETQVLNTFNAMVKLTTFALMFMEKLSPISARSITRASSP